VKGNRTIARGEEEVISVPHRLAFSTRPTESERPLYAFHSTFEIREHLYQQAFSRRLELGSQPVCPQGGARSQSLDEPFPNDVSFSLFRYFPGTELVVLTDMRTVSITS